MNYTQNSKIAQVTERSLVVGVDIGSETNYARAFNWRVLRVTGMLLFYSSEASKGPNAEHNFSNDLFF